MANPNHIEAIPPELLCMVVDYIQRPTDLKNLCLTSRSFRNVAIGRLYRNVVLHGKTPKWPDLELGKGLLKTSNPGLLHTRALTAHATDRLSTAKVCAFLRDILPLLPRNRLMQLNLPGISLDKGTMFALCAQQSALKSLRLGSIPFDFAADLKGGIFGADLWSNLRAIHVTTSLRTAAELSIYQELMRRCLKLSELSVDCQTQLRHDPAAPMLGDNILDKDRIIASLFSHVDSKDLSARLSLRSLALSRRSLRASGTALTQYIRFDELRHLSLQECAGISQFLTALSGPFRWIQPALREIFIRSKVEDVEAGALYQFLEAFQGLRSLMIMVDCVVGTFDLQAIQGHKSTLRALSLALGAHNDTVEDLALSLNLSAALRDFAWLRYLAVPMPRLVLTEPCSWSLYERSLRELSCLSLQALRIVSLPTVSTGFFLHGPEECDEVKEEQMNKEVYKTKLKGFISSNGVKALASRGTRPPVLIFKGNYRTLYQEDTARTGEFRRISMAGDPLCFFPIIQSNMFGATNYGYQEATTIDAIYSDTGMYQLIWPW